MLVQRGFVALMSVVLLGLLASGVWGVVASATPGSGVGSQAQAPTPSTPAVPAPTVAFSPAAGSADVAPDRPVAVAAVHARLDGVALTGGGGASVAGALTPDGHRWQASAPLAYGATYTWSGRALGEDGSTVPLTGSFRTVAPADLVAAHVNIGDGDTVGIAAPIIVQFDQHITDKAAAERAMTVHTSVPTTGSWAWLDDDNGGSRAHWRPKDYWQPGTQVDVAINQFGVDDGGGAWGRADVTSHFTIGRSQIVRADVTSHEMVVVRDGQEVMRFPASYGLGSDPNRNTTNGIHVVMEKTELKLMSNPQYGYENVPEHWAVRIQNNGEFIHANPATTGVQGSENVTHGCVNLSTDDAHEYFDSAIFGDPVEVTNSPVPLTMSTGDIADWTVPWDQWQQMSAVRA